MDESLTAQVSAVAALDEPSRRLLYDHVARQPGPVSRDEAAAAVEMPRATAAFHLDRLVDEGLLEVSYQRRTGRTGPGAGRTAKLYRRSGRQVGVSLPERRYDLAGRLLASAVAEAERTGDSPRAVLERRAHELGRELADTARTEGGLSEDETAVLRVLEAYGFEPRAEGTDVVLANCPFHTLAQEHTELVCGMNLCLLDGLLGGLGDTGLSARLDPKPGHCCVRLGPDRRPRS
ncbi:MAG: helix-turn-helix transcriptional regulator [Haloechinothrix sp.]